MQTFTCACEQRLFFENSQCLGCGRPVGWCPACQTLTALEPTGTFNEFTCARPSCRTRLRLCENYARYQVCNRCVAADQDPPDGTRDHPLCDMCCFNDVIPDLSVTGNVDRWRRLEIAKRRMLWLLQLLNLPPFDARAARLRLTIDFKADAIRTQQGWQPMGTEKVYTGYADGRITLNIREADSVEREKLRVSFGESHRTLIGHFRHEIAHYLYDVCVAGTGHYPGFVALFGDPNNPPYADALPAYYRNGPPADWQRCFISAYASMHPLEDWAETAAAVLEAHSVLDTACHHGFTATDPAVADFDTLLDRFIDLGIFLNEVNRAMGLLDVVPGVVTPTVRDKLAFAHRCLAPSRAAGNPPGPAGQASGR